MKQDQDLRTIIASHEAELTDMERDIAQYFLSSEARQHSLSSSRVTELLHVSKAALTRFSQKCGFTGYREFVYHLTKKPKIKNRCKSMTNSLSVSCNATTISVTSLKVW